MGESIPMKDKNNHPGTLISQIEQHICTCILLIIFVLTPVFPALAQIEIASNEDMESEITANKDMNSTVMKVIQNVRQANAELADELIQIYENTKRFQDIEVALAEGYIPDPLNLCETAPMMGQPAFVGAMGIHYFRPDLLGVTETQPRVNGVGLHTDFRNPSILIYEPQEDGSMELVAIENLVFQKGWDNANPNKKPNFMGHDYFTMIDNPLTEVDEAHMFEPHYDLHMYLYRENPNGLFNPFNPAVNCDFHTANMGMDMN